MTNRKAWDDAYYERNKEEINAKKSIRYQENKEKVRAKQAEYYRKNKHVFAQKSMKRYANKTNQTPCWLTKSHLLEIEKMYEYCQIFNNYIQNPDKKFQVDHIVPLRGKQISGLHTPWNLQVLTCKENAVKRNTFNPSKYPRQGNITIMEKIND